MRRWAAYGTAALLAISAAGGVIYAQDTAPAPAGTEAVAPPMSAARTWLGVRVSESENGVTVTEVVAGSPAETAQLAVNDVITAVGNTSIASADDLRAAIEAASSGDVVQMTIVRGGVTMVGNVTLGERAGGMGMFSDPLQTAGTLLGAELETVESGYQVVTVNDGAPFELAAGDVITAVNGTAVSEVDWRTLLQPSNGSTVTLTVQRDGAEVTLTGELTMMGGGGPGNNGGQPNGQPPSDGQNQPAATPPVDGQPGGNGGGPGGGPPPSDGQNQPPGGGMMGSDDSI